MAVPAEGNPEPPLSAVLVRCREHALRLARRLTRGTGEDAEDLVHNAILRVLDRDPTGLSEEHAKAYLLATIHNQWRNRLRGRSREANSLRRMHDPGPGLEVDDMVLETIAGDTALRALAAMSPPGRLIIELRVVQDLEYSEIAVQLGISETAARQRMHRARTELISQCVAAETRHIHSECGWVRQRLGICKRRDRQRRDEHLTSCEECRMAADEVQRLLGRRGL